MDNGIYFISGIDTNIGKSIATGYLAQQIYSSGKKSVITQKLVQTGNRGFSEDILIHRKLMGTDLLPEDKNHLTMPQIFSFPSSPHLAAKLEHKQINLQKISDSTYQLKKNFDIVLIEGAGGLMVPLTQMYLTIDYIQKQNYRIILVTNGRLGSINHTLLSLNLLKYYQLELFALIYNHHHENPNQIIEQDTQHFFREYLNLHFPKTIWIELPSLKN